MNNENSLTQLKQKQVILITGANGFIGSHISCELINLGFDIIGLSRSFNSKNTLFNDYVKQNKIKLLLGDIQNFDFSVLTQVDYIIHIASRVSPYGKMEDFKGVNLGGTKNLLKFALNKKPKCFVYFSSTAVYGFNGYTNLEENAIKKPFNNPYSISKLETENFVKNFCSSNKLNYVIIRPGNVYGEFDYTSSYKIFTRIKNKKMLICAKGKYKSCFVYVKNLVYATIFTMLNKKCYNSDFNISDGNNETLKEMFDCIANNFNVKQKYKNFPAFLAKFIAIIYEGTYKILGFKKAPLITKFSVWQNCNDYNFSINKIKSMGYSPIYSMEEGVKNTCNWINKLEEIKNANKRRD